MMPSTTGASAAIFALALCSLAGCSGPLVNIAPVPPASYSEGAKTSGEACGMLVFGLIPVSLNDRVERAYGIALEKSGATSLTDSVITEDWYFTPVGPGLCTKVEGAAITRATSQASAPPPRAEMREMKRGGS